MAAPRRLPRPSWRMAAKARRRRRRSRRSRRPISKPFWISWADYEQAALRNLGGGLLAGAEERGGARAPRREGVYRRQHGRPLCCSAAITAGGADDGVERP